MVSRLGKFLSCRIGGIPRAEASARRNPPLTAPIQFNVATVVTARATEDACGVRQQVFYGAIGSLALVDLGQQLIREGEFVALEGKSQRPQLPQRQRAGQVVVAVKGANSLDEPASRSRQCDFV